MLCTSLSILHGLKASGSLHGRGYDVGLPVAVGLSLLGLYLCWGKPWIVTSQSRSVSSSPPKPLQWPVFRLCLARSRSLLPASPSSVPFYHTTTILSLVGSLLVITSWHPLCSVAPLASLSSLIVALLLGYVQSWYCTASVAAANPLGRPM